MNKKSKMIFFLVFGLSLIMSLVFLGCGDDDNRPIVQVKEKSEQSNGKAIVGKAIEGIKGMGVEGNPYLIEKPDHLKHVRNNLKAHFKVVKPLDMSGVSNFEPIGNAKTDKKKDRKPFIGVFDGGGKEIRGLTKWINHKSHYGFFGYIGKGAVVKNVKLVGLKLDISHKLDSGREIGGLVGLNEGGTIENSEVRSGEVKTTIMGIRGMVGNVGGFVGVNRGGRIKGSTANVDVDAKGFNVGGLVGLNTTLDLKGEFHPIIENSQATGNVTGGMDIDYGNVGGLVGNNTTRATIENSQAEGTIKTRKLLFPLFEDEESDKGVGGLVGVNEGTISRGEATGTVEGKYNVGGLVGFNNGDGDIKKNKALGVKVKGYDEVGGLVGFNKGRVGVVGENGNIAEGTVEGKNNVGGLVGLNEGQIHASKFSGEKSNVTGDENVGGLVGFNEINGTIRNSDFTAGKKLIVEKDKIAKVENVVTGNKSVGSFAGKNQGNIRNSNAKLISEAKDKNGKSIRVVNADKIWAEIKKLWAEIKKAAAQSKEITDKEKERDKIDEIEKETMRFIANAEIDKLDKLMDKRQKLEENKNNINKEIRNLKRNKGESNKITQLRTKSNEKMREKETLIKKIFVGHNVGHDEPNVLNSKRAKLGNLCYDTGGEESDQLDCGYQASK